MASENLTFDVLARDRASATFNKIGQSTAALETRFARLTRAATGIATTLVGAQIGKSVLDAADKFELSRSRLETITKNIGQNFGALSGQVDAADKRMEKFGYTNAQAEGNLASLESATKNPAKALRDLAIAADLARGRNIGLEEATGLLMKVETGHVALLGRYGIATKDAAGHTLTQAEALDALAKLYGGSAAHFAETFAGKQAAVAASMQDTAAKIGVALLPAALDLAKVIQQDVLPPIESLAKFLDRNRKVIEPLAKAGIELTLMWKGYTLATRAAAEMTALFSKRAIVAAAALDTEAVAGSRAAVAASRLGRLPAALGAGAVVAGSFVPGKAGSILTAAGSGALLGSAFGPEGALLGAAVGGGIAAVAGGQSQRDKLTKQAESSAAGYAKVQDYLASRQRELTKAMQDGTNTTAGGIRGQIKLAQAALKAADGQNTAKKAAATYAKALDEELHGSETISKQLLNLRSAQDSLRSAMHAAAQTAVDNGKALTGNSDAALANRDAVRAQATAMFATLDAMKEHGASESRVADMTAILTQAIEQNAIKLYGDKTAVDALLASLGLLPGKVDAASRALASLPATAQNELASGDLSTTGKSVQLYNQALAGQKKKGQKIGESFTSGYTPVVSKAAEKAAKAVSDSMQKALDKVNNDLQTIRDAINQTTASVASFADFSTSGTDSLGATGIESDVLGQLRDKGARLKDFANAYVQAARMGLDPHLLAQFAAAGPDAIDALRTIIHGGRSYTRQVNAAEQQIQASAGRVATADQAAQNLGLIHRDLQTLPHKLERVFITGLRSVHIVTDVKAIDAANGKRILS